MTTTELNSGIGVDRAGGTVCSFCSKELTKKQKTNKRKFCSHRCYSKDKVGRKHNHGHKISKALKGVPKTREHIENSRRALIGRKRPEITGEKHPGWKGDRVNYGTLHDWIRQKLGKPKKCSLCGVSNSKTRYEWSNVSGKYTRDFSDWTRLCSKCHKKVDRGKSPALKVFHKKYNQPWHRK